MGEWHMIWVYQSEKRKTQVANALTVSCLFRTCEAYAAYAMQEILEFFLAQNSELLNRIMII